MSSGSTTILMILKRSGFKLKPVFSVTFSHEHICTSVLFIKLQDGKVVYQNFSDTYWLLKFYVMLPNLAHLRGLRACYSDTLIW